MKTIHLWMIQPCEIWEALQVQKTLLAAPADSNFDEDWPEACAWMREQMRGRLPDCQGLSPWWGYDYKLDLRSQRHQYPPGRWVRIELDIPPERVLLSAYGAWHYVLSHWYLPYSVDEKEHERESDAWDDELARHGYDPFKTHDIPVPWRSKIVASWRRIFDVDDLRATNTIQGCFERLSLADVICVTEFQGKRTT